MFLLKLAVALICLFVLMYFGMGAEQQWLTMGFTERMLRLAVLMIVGLMGYFGVLWLTGFRVCDFRKRTQ